jgi:hypothetical protein
VKRAYHILLIACAAILVAQGEAHACPSCFGAPDSPQTEGIKWAILSLLGITGTVLAGVGAFVLYLRKKTLEFNRRFDDMLN